MMREDSLDELLLIARELAEQPNWQGLALFFDRRGKGFRGQAFAALNEFLAFSENWPFEERLRLTRWLVDRRQRVGADTMLLPQPLFTRLVSPTLWDWLAREPSSAEAHFLMASIAIWPDEAVADRHSHLLRALALDPAHDRAREMLFNWLTGEVEYRQHELPRFYIGDAEEDLATLAEAQIMANGFCDPKLREWAHDEVSLLREVAVSWLAKGDS